MKTKPKNLVEPSSLFAILKQRFLANPSRHSNISWEMVSERLSSNTGKLKSLELMENTGGEPDVIGIDEATNALIFCDCSAESPKERRSLCYDIEAQQSRKENAPLNNVESLAQSIGIELLDEHQYRKLQMLGTFDAKTSSWIKTPIAIRKLGGALFADFRYGQVFIYHNSATSYYSSRGFRGILKV